MDTLIKALTTATDMKLDNDLFAYDIPLGKSGAWVADRQTDNLHNGVDYLDFSIYYRDKSKTSAMKNINYIKNTIDATRLNDSECITVYGKSVRIDMPYSWDYLEKDSEGYYCFANQLRLYL